MKKISLWAVEIRVQANDKPVFKVFESQNKARAYLATQETIGYCVWIWEL